MHHNCLALIRLSPEAARRFLVAVREGPGLEVVGQPIVLVTYAIIARGSVCPITLAESIAGIHNGLCDCAQSVQADVVTIVGAPPEAAPTYRATFRTLYPSENQ